MYISTNTMYLYISNTYVCMRCDVMYVTSMQILEHHYPACTGNICLFGMITIRIPKWMILIVVAGIVYYWYHIIQTVYDSIAC